MSAELAHVCEPSAPPFLLARAVVTAVERISPAFIRVKFGGPQLREAGTPGRSLDQRIKLIFPPDSGLLPQVDFSESWYQSWLRVPERERGAMRTYSIRDVIVDDAGTQIVVDFVLHCEPGLTGPASTWAAAAEPGSQIYMLAPRRDRFDGGGIEFDPAGARQIVLIGDETAAPAIARILEDTAHSMAQAAKGPTPEIAAFIEVPSAADILPIAMPAQAHVTWLPRADQPHGTVLIPEVLRFLEVGRGGGEVQIEDVDSEELLWETPVYSGLGEAILGAPSAVPDSYYWIAGESGVVTTLRRHLVKDLGVDRSQVAFMGYWRRGVAMRG